MKNFKIEKVIERDIDLLIINNIINDKILKLFLDKLDLKGYKIIEIEHSHVDTNLGESDITVILEKDKYKIGILIEDKINAPTMDLQPERYIERGRRGLNNKYDEFRTIIVAPKQYLNSNPNIKKYQYQISYEEILKTLSDDIYAKVLINKELEEKKQKYILIENKNVTKFWEDYYAFVKSHYPTIKIHEINGPRGTNARWPEFQTNYKQVKIIHKSDKGYIDLTFDKMANHIDIFDKYTKNIKQSLSIVKTGKSLSIRLNVPKIDFKSKFYIYIDQMHECMEQILNLYDILSKINVLMMYNESNQIN